MMEVEYTVDMCTNRDSMHCKAGDDDNRQTEQALYDGGNE